MFDHKNKILLVSSLAVLLTAYGCGQKRIESTQVPGSNELTKEKATLASSGHYRVGDHDCLWTIAGKSKIYGDPFEWPQLYKANRDQIKDPDLIYPKQMLKVEKGLSSEELNSAKHLALVTPKYIPHSKPRETLPVDYF